PQHRTLDSEAAVSGYDLVGFGVDGNRWGISLSPSQQAEKDAAVDEAIAAVNATAYAGRRLGQLSGGERQRLLLAQALVGKPQLLLLDEPAANLDLKNQIALAELVAKLATERNIAVLLVTHDLNPLLHVVDRVLYIGRHGVAIGSSDEVITAPVLSRLYNTNVEVLKDKHGRQFIVGLEDVMAHPHGHDHNEDQNI
ncbi:MAG: ATP-binding cassette domain-containing protein, partial [Chloroflexota bacterium]